MSHQFGDWPKRWIRRIVSVKEASAASLLPWAISRVITLLALAFARTEVSTHRRGDKRAIGSRVRRVTEFRCGLVQIYRFIRISVLPRKPPLLSASPSTHAIVTRHHADSDGRFVTPHFELLCVLGEHADISSGQTLNRKYRSSSSGGVVVQSCPARLRPRHGVFGVPIHSSGSRGLPVHPK